MLTVSGFLVCASLEEADRLSLLLPAHLDRCRAEPGCRSVEIWRSMADPLRFALLHRFDDRAAHARHLQARAGSAWATAVRDLERGLRLDEE